MLAKKQGLHTLCAALHRFALQRSSIEALHLADYNRMIPRWFPVSQDCENMWSGIPLLFHAGWLSYDSPPGVARACYEQAGFEMIKDTWRLSNLCRLGVICWLYARQDLRGHIFQFHFLSIPPVWTAEHLCDYFNPEMTVNVCYRFKQIVHTRWIKPGDPLVLICVSTQLSSVKEWYSKSNMQCCAEIILNRRTEASQSNWANLYSPPLQIDWDPMGFFRFFSPLRQEEPDSYAGVGRRTHSSLLWLGRVFRTHFWNTSKPGSHFDSESHSESTVAALLRYTLFIDWRDARSCYQLPSFLIRAETKRNWNAAICCLRRTGRVELFKRCKLYHTLPSLRRCRKLPRRLWDRSTRRHAAWNAWKLSSKNWQYILAVWH